MDDAVQMLEKISGDPIADAVKGSVRIVSASERVGRRRYQACELVVLTQAEGIPETRVKTEVVTTAKTWPRVGSVLPALIARNNPRRMEINWDALARQ